VSSPLYAVKVVALRGTLARFDIVSVCEAGCFTLSRLFAVHLLCEPFWITTYERPGRVWPRRIDGPLRSLFSRDELIDWAGGGVPGAEESRLAIVRDVAYGGLRNVPALSVRADPDGLLRSSARTSQAFHDALAQAYGRRGLDGLPAAALQIEVGEARFLAHLAPGMTWDSYAFDDEGATLF
jgi:hypothetical protein